MLCLQFSVALQNVAHIALERAADAVERRKAHALGLAAAQNGKIRLRDADNGAKLLACHAARFQHLVEMYRDRHGSTLR